MNRRRSSLWFATCPKCGAHGTYRANKEFVCPRTRLGLCDGKPPSKNNPKDPPTEREDA